MNQNRKERSRKTIGKWVLNWERDRGEIGEGVSRVIWTSKYYTSNEYRAQGGGREE